MCSCDHTAEFRYGVEDLPAERTSVVDEVLDEKRSLKVGRVSTKHWSGNVLVATRLLGRIARHGHFQAIYQRTASSGLVLAILNA